MRSTKLCLHKLYPVWETLPYSFLGCFVANCERYELDAGARFTELLPHIISATVEGTGESCMI